jgi:integrase
MKTKIYLAALLLAIGCEKAPPALQTGDAILGLASAVQLQSDSTELFLEDYFLDRAGIDRQKTKRKGVGRGITDKTFHSWRHTTNSLLVDAGVDQRVRQLICDHDSVKVSNNYTHASIETMAKALESLTTLAK